MSWIDPRSLSEGLPAWAPVPASASPPVVGSSSHGAVAWAIVGMSRAWVWRPEAGLVAVRDLSPLTEDPRQAEADTHIGAGSLSPDGTMLRYAYRNREAVYDLLRGERAIAPDRRIHRETVVFTGPSGAALEASVPEPRYLEPEPPVRFFVSSKTTSFPPPTGDRLQLPFVGVLARTFNGPSVQFTRDGRWAAVGLEYQPQGLYSTHIVDLSFPLMVEHHAGYAVATQGAWSPNGDRLLITTGPRNPSPRVLEVVSRTTRDLAPVLEPYYPEHHEDAWTVAGWVDDSRVMVSRFRRRRLEVGLLDVDTDEHTDLLDIPARAHTILEFAPWVAQDDPASIGRADSPGPRSVGGRP